MKRALYRLTILASGFAMVVPAFGWPRGSCPFRAERTAQVDAAGAKAVVIIAGAGDLSVRGVTEGTVVRVTSKACAPARDLLADASVRIERVGDAILVNPGMPKRGVVGLLGIHKPYADVIIEMPMNIPISLNDSTGDTDAFGIAGGKIVGGSGNLVIRDTSGSLDITGGSGDIRIAGVGGQLTLSDTSGDILISDVKGNVLIPKDGSGNITILRSGGDVSILQDSSGDVTVDGVAGNFHLGTKGSGRVHVDDVKGRIVQ